MKPLPGVGPAAIVLRPAGESAEFLRALVGREVRARVLSAAAPGEATRLRIGASVLPARVEGRALSAEQDLFLRVERAGKNGYRLLILEAGRPAAPAVLHPGAGPALPFGLEVLLREQLAAGKKPRAAPEALRTPPSESLGEGLSRILERAAESSEALARWLTESAASLDTQLLIEWARGGADGAADDPAETPPDWIAGVGRLGPGPHVFLLHAHPESLGAITAVFLSESADFDPLHVYVSAAEAGARMRLAERWSDWLRALAEEGVGISGATLLGVSAGLDVSA